MLADGLAKIGGGAQGYRHIRLVEHGTDGHRDIARFRRSLEVLQQFPTIPLGDHDIQQDCCRAASGGEGHGPVGIRGAYHLPRLPGQIALDESEEVGVVINNH